MFSAPLPPEPGQADWPPPPPSAPKQGAFTQMFQNPPAAQPQRQEPETGGEFTHFFGNPKEAPMPPPAQPSQPGGYTQMFSSAPVAPPQVHGPSSGATNVFAAPAASGPEVPQGPSEYTRMMSRPQGLPGAESGSAAPGTPAGMAMPGMPQVPQIPHVAGMPSYSAPRAPQMPTRPPMPVAPRVPQMPQTQVPKGPISNTALIVGICVLAVAALGLVLFLLLRH